MMPENAQDLVIGPEAIGGCFNDEHLTIYIVYNNTNGALKDILIESKFPTDQDLKIELTEEDKNESIFNNFFERQPQPS